jgi:hypothetical protein
VAVVDGGACSVSFQEVQQHRAEDVRKIHYQYYNFIFRSGCKRCLPLNPVRSRSSYLHNPFLFFVLPIWVRFLYVLHRLERITAHINASLILNNLFRYTVLVDQPRCPSDTAVSSNWTGLCCALVPPRMAHQKQRPSHSAIDRYHLTYLLFGII